MSTSGACSLTPSISAAKRRGISPADRLTSVDVPPMSKPIRRRGPSALPAAIMPTTPPAGPDSTPLTPRKPAASTSPPLLCMKLTRASPCTACSSARNALVYRSSTGDR